MRSRRTEGVALFCVFLLSCAGNASGSGETRLKGDEESQKKTFTNVAQSRRAFAVREVTLAGDDDVPGEATDDDRDLIDLNDDLGGDDSDQDFP